MCLSEYNKLTRMRFNIVLVSFTCYTKNEKFIIPFSTERTNPHFLLFSQ